MKAILLDYANEGDSQFEIDDFEHQVELGGMIDIHKDLMPVHYFLGHNPNLPEVMQGNSKGFVTCKVCDITRSVTKKGKSLLILQIKTQSEEES